MELILYSIFIIGYLAIVLEHPLKIDKLVPALIMMTVLWAIMSVFQVPVYEVNIALRELEFTNYDFALTHHLGKTSEILFFLIGAMTIVEIIDYFDGFSIIKKIIKMKKHFQLIWVFSILAFILSAIIDNLTATIVLLTILSKIVKEKKLKLWYVGIIIISANAGGAWSPIGDVTTTMLWIANKVTVVNLVKYIFLPSVVCFLLPTLLVSYLPVIRKHPPIKIKEGEEPKNISILIVGLLAIIFVPVFKVLTHLPPYFGMCLSMAVVVIVAEIQTKRKFSFKEMVPQKGGMIHHALSKIEFTSILFFLGILMAVAALESAGELFHLAELINESIPNKNIVILLLGAASAIIDNVPLVAASIGMFPEPTNDIIWHLLAYSAGTGGSMLIIGSAAGVIAMGIEKIDFIDYFKKISLLALIGFVSGYITTILMH